MVHIGTISWGIIGTGKSAHNFARALGITKNAQLVAVGSRNEEKANNFAKEFGIPFSFSSYLQLVNSPKLDIVYIATPNSYHKENALLCLNAGKNVLIEKPFTTNSQDAKILIAEAKRNNLFLMEAMWTRFTPAFEKIEKLVKSGDIGKIISFHATLGQPSVINQDSNLFKKSMGGGSLLDLGVYPFFLTQFFFGSPIRVQGYTHCGDTDVDLTASIVLSYGRGRFASISTSIATRFTNNGMIYGTKGAIEIHQPLYCPTSISVIKYKKTVISTKNKKSFLGKILDKIKSFPILQNLYANFPILGQYILRNRRKNTIYLPIKGNGLQYMAKEVSNYLIDKSMNSKIIPLDTTISVIETIDKAKSELNVN
jgi:predicted dehydrogenase